jgi:hypothetical protein
MEGEEMTMRVTIQVTHCHCLVTRVLQWKKKKMTMRVIIQVTHCHCLVARVTIQVTHRHCSVTRVEAFWREDTGELLDIA